MAITITEHVDSREFSGGSRTFHYILTGADDDLDALDSLLAAVPETYDGLVRESTPTVKPIWVNTVAGDGQWDCTVRYNPPSYKKFPEPEIGSIRIRGTTKGGTMHIVQSLETMQVEVKSGAKVYFGAAPGNVGGGGIGYDGEQFQGCDIGVPVLVFTATKVFASDGLPSLANIIALNNKVNDAQFSVTDTLTNLNITLAAGECLFNGADFGDPRGDGGVEFAYEFVGSPNATGLKVGEISNTLSKKGHEYLWVYHEKTADETARKLPKKPAAAYVERVYNTGAFSGLGL